MSFILNPLKERYHSTLQKFGFRKTHCDISTPEKSTTRANVFSSILGSFETYVVSLQSLLIWERPYLSAGAFVTINCLYWFIVSWNRRFLSILSIGAIITFVYKTWVSQIWPEIRVESPDPADTEDWTTVNPQVLSAPELSRYLNDYLNKMILLWKDIWKLRKENHGLFCALMCGFLSVIAVIGHLIPGVLIVYILVLTLSLGPGVALHLIPSNLYDQLIGYFSETEAQSDPPKSPLHSEDSDLEEFIPENTAELIRQLSLKEVVETPSPGMVLTESGDPVHMDDTNESECFSLYQGLGAFPSVEEEGESEESISETVPKVEAPPPSEIRFLTSHFKEDSSGSESEAVFTEGLSFSGTQEAPTQPQHRVSTSSDNIDLDDFEILEESDLLS